MLITPEGLEAAAVHCAALSWTFRGSLRNGCEESREKTTNRKRVDGGGLVIWREVIRTENLGMWVGVELCMLGSK